MAQTNRRHFLRSTTTSAAALAAQPHSASAAKRYSPPSDQLTGANLKQLRDAYRAELFDVQLPFWSEHWYAPLG